MGALHMPVTDTTQLAVCPQVFRRAWTTSLLTGHTSISLAESQLPEKGQLEYYQFIVLFFLFSLHPHLIPAKLFFTAFG